MSDNISSNKIKYLYILSQRYSGSTLLSFLLATHPDVSTIGERRKFYNKSIKTAEFAHHKARHCSCGERFENCPYLNEIRKRVLSRIDSNALATNTTEFNIYNNKYLNRIAYEIIRFYSINKWSLKWTPFSEKIKELCHFNFTLAHEILDYDNSRAFLDTSKIINHALFLSMIKEFDFYVVWLVRDPRAQINSALKYNKWSIEYAAQHWMQEMQENEKILKGLGLKSIKLRYEDLCRSPESELTNIFKFTGLDENQFSLDFRTQTQHIIGNGKMRLGNDKIIKERKEWQSELSAKQIKSIERLTADYTDLYA